MSKDSISKLAGTSPQSKLLFPNKNTGKVMSTSSMGLNDGEADTITEQLAPFGYSTNRNLVSKNIVPKEKANPNQVSEDVQQLNILANSPLMTSSRNPTEYLQASKVSGPSETLPSTSQNLGSQEQTMQQQIKQLQRLVAEQQRIITLYHSGFLFSTGMPPHLQPVSPSLASSLLRTYLESFSQFPNNGNNLKIMSQTPLMMNLPTTYSESNRSSENPEEGIQTQFADDISREEEMYQKRLSPIKEDKGEKTDSQIPLSPFGLRIHSRTRNIEERPNRPGIRIKQKIFEEFIEEQFKMDSQRVENQPQKCKNLNSCQSRTSPRKPFLKCREHIARLKQNKNLFRKNSKQCNNQMTGQVCLSTQSHFCLPQSQDWEKHKQENHLELECPANTHMSKEKEIANMPSQEVARENTTSSKSKENNQSLQERNSEHVKGETILTSGVNWPDPMQQHYDQESESKAQMDGKNKSQFLDCHNHLDNRVEPTDDQVQQHFDILNAPPIAEKTKVTPRNSGHQEVVQNQEKQEKGTQEKHNSPKVRFVSCQPNEKLVSFRATPGHRIGANTEFKKVNDRIVKNVHQLAKGIEKEKEYILASDHKRKQQDSRRMVNLGNAESSSSDEKSSFLGSAACYHLSPRNKDLPNVNHAYQNLDLSESDYASDEHSGSEEMTLRRSSKFFVKKWRSQELLESKDDSSRASSRKSSMKIVELRGSRALSSFQTSRDHHIKPTRSKKELKTKNTTKSMQIPDVQPLACDLVASLSSTSKEKVNSTEEICKTFHKDILEAQKRPSGKLEELEEEIDEIQGKNPLLSQVKAEQEKVMQFLSTQISQVKVQKAKEVNFSDEHWKEENPQTQLKETNLEKWTKTSSISKKDEDKKEMLNLKQQIYGLQEQFKINESRWFVAHIKLQSQIEVLMKQNLELQDELRASEHQRLEISKKSLALHSPRRKSESLESESILRGPSSLSKNEGTLMNASPTSCRDQRLSSDKYTSLEPVNDKIEKVESKKATSRENGEKNVSPSLRVKSPPPTEKRSTLEQRIPSFDPEMVIYQSPRNLQNAHMKKSPVPISPHGMYNEESLPAYENDRSVLTSGNYEEALLLQARQNDHRSSTFHQTEDTQVVKDFSSKLATSRKLLWSMKNKKKEKEVQKEIKHPDGKVEWKFSDGRKTITFPNGNKKEISADKKTTIVTFANGDMQKFMPDHRVLYYYADAQTTHTTYPDGLEVLQFPNKQIEKHYPNGTKEIVFPDGTVKHLSVEQEETVFPDGTLVKVERNGDKTILFSNGQKEIHTSQFKKREFPDGTIKTVFNTGHQETKYPSGRVRIKDEAGRIILDKK
ncbi:uncharacterized protein LOC141488184 isoform X2 [Macrotis lagotis]|uniref:uncharacterized protein LOC141488184 isoform X2 n=1 Tax=Macrotis lagotis TaxID=92651 RepID=UPI003D697FEA